LLMPAFTNLGMAVFGDTYYLHLWGSGKGAALWRPSTILSFS
jgi:hypothetical protein